MCVSCLFAAGLDGVFYLPRVCTDLRKTDFTFCAPYTWNKLGHMLLVLEAVKAKDTIHESDEKLFKRRVSFICNGFED